MLGFGFALFLMMVILALIYSQYAAQKMGGSVDTTSAENTTVKTKTMMEPTKSPSAPVPTVTVDTATDDLIDEAVADRDDMTILTDDEIADMTEGN